MDFDRYVEGLEQRRRDRPGPENLVVLPSVASTNALARSVIAEYQNEGQTLHPLLVLALEQSGGRGRQGRNWSSPRGKGVYATRVLQVADPSMLQTLPLLVGIGLCRALSRHLPAPCRLKWPNDLLVEVGGERRKIGGILIEASVQPGEEAVAIVGFGVNYLHEAADLPENATSLGLLKGNVASLASLASLEDLTWDLVEGVEAELAHLGDPDHRVAAVERYREQSVHQPGERIVFRAGDSVIEGTFQGFDETGRLLLDREGETVALAAGEVIEG